MVGHCFASVVAMRGDLAGNLQEISMAKTLVIASWLMPEAKINGRLKYINSLYFRCRVACALKYKPDRRAEERSLLNETSRYCCDQVSPGGVAVPKNGIKPCKDAGSVSISKLRYTLMGQVHIHAEVRRSKIKENSGAGVLYLFLRTSAISQPTAVNYTRAWVLHNSQVLLMTADILSKFSQDASSYVYIAD